MAEIIERDEDGRTLRRLASGTYVEVEDDGSVAWMGFQEEPDYAAEIEAERRNEEALYGNPHYLVIL